MEVQIIDSHTAGEPTRVVIGGGPDLGGGSLAERRERFRREHDAFRRAVILEPRGSDVLVGALLCDSPHPDCVAGVVFFNNVDVLNMCGHGAIGLAVTLAHMGRIKPGPHQLDTPVGIVPFELLDNHRVRIRNVPSYRYRTGVAIETSRGPLNADIAWGGNWFLLAESPLPLEPHAIPRAHRRRGGSAASTSKPTASPAKRRPDRPHRVLRPVAERRRADARDFVLCPGAAYDRSPCGTGTSAKVACLAADGKLAPGQTWVQESIIGSRFEASAISPAPKGRILPTITGSAYVYGEGRLLFDAEDPFRHGIQP
jgi:4-hydroxyproline epimerase